MKYVDMKMNENDLINMFNKEELRDLLDVQIQHENYEGAKVVKSAIDQYDYCHPPTPNIDDDINFNIDDNEPLQ